MKLFFSFGRSSLRNNLQDAINNFVDKILVQYGQEKNEHIVTIKFKLPLVKDKIDHKDPDDKGKGYSIKKGKEKLVGSVIPTPRGKKVPSYQTILL